MYNNLILQLAAIIFLNSCNSQEKNAFSLKENQKETAIDIKAETALENKPTVSKIAPAFTFRFAARKAMPTVVHIKSYFSKARRFPYSRVNDFRYHFFSPDANTSQLLVGNASGVIVRSDGYIVTNDHVVNSAQTIEVVLHDKRSYKATVIGTDPATDLALLKIDERKLQCIEFGNSDLVEVGDVVLAVGNPFNLASTVTAGIVSSKARNINVLTDKAAVESYIQTDAAVNPGNSGGALVDINGKLIGINGAIATPTGVYAGYSFAIPVEIVKKTIDDLLKYGKVLRGYLGVIISDMGPEKAKQLGIGAISGVIIDSLQKNGAAMKAGIQKNDVITKIDDHPVESSPQMREIVARHHPGEKVRLTIIRSGRQKTIWVTLIAEQETIVLESKEAQVLKALGIIIEEISSDEKKQIKINGGVKVISITEGIISQATNMQEGFIIVAINDALVNTTEDFFHAMQNIYNLIIFEGFYPDDPGLLHYYVIGIKD